MGLNRRKRASSFLLRLRQLYLELEYGFKGWLARQADLILPHLMELGEAARAWGEECWHWMKGDLKERTARACLFLQDLRTGKRRVEIPAFAKTPRFYAAVLAGFLLLGGNFYLLQNRLVYAVSYQGKEIGYVASRRAGEELKAQVERELERRLGQDVFLPVSLAYEACFLPRTRLTSQGELLKAYRELPWLLRGVEIVINGEPVLVVQSGEAADRVLARVKERYRKELAGERIEKIEFRESVSLRSRLVPAQEVAPLQEAVALLQQGRVQARRYRVKEGDSLWSIARAHSLLVEDLFRANPELTSDRLDIGQELKLAASEPLLNVMITSTAVKKETIPYEVQVELDSRLWRGQTRIHQAGAEGEAEVTYRLVRQNGAVISREVAARRVLKEPVARVVVQGTRRMVATARMRVSRGSGSGTLGWPVGGSITSGYGYRGREFHGGIDIAADYGAPVAAAAGGQVVFAGWDGGYGRTVVIDHGNGLATRYAHLSRVDVSSGEAVGRGEAIGAVGATGRASGPHLHFEVLVNGARVNPYHYLR